MSSSTSSIPFLWSQETDSLPFISCSHLHPAPSQVEGRLVSPMGTQRFLLLHLLETPWQQSNPVIAFERTHPLALEMGRPFVKRGPSASTAHQQLLHKGCHVLPLLAPGPGSTLQLAPCLPAITTNHLTFQLVAQSLVWRQKEEGDHAGRKNGGLLQALCCPSVLVSSSSLAPPPSAPVAILLAIWQASCPRR